MSAAPITPDNFKIRYPWWEYPFMLLGELTCRFILWPLYNWTTRRELERETRQIVAR